MLKEQLQSDFNYYQNANADAAVIREGFLVRKYEFSVISDDLLRHAGQRSVQHYLLLGKRGSGKSTLLRRIQVEIDMNEKLSSQYIAINLAEEQANIYRMFDLLEEIIDELEYHNIGVENVEEDDDAYTFSRRLFAVIHKALEKTGKKLVLLLDNIDRIFENLDDEVSLLRENLENFGDIKIIGASTRMSEHFWAYNKPFYEFFRVMELKPLKSKEVKDLLLSWADALKIDQLKDFVEKRPGQLETIRLLTDGLPRTLQFFVNILLTRNQENGYEYLRLLMDKVTPLYQERLNNLPPSQRKIILQLSFLWEAAGAKDLAETTKMETRIISAQLNQLIEKGVVDKVETKTKNHLYRLSERFFNLWLIFTQGSPKEKRRARYLSIFLESFYDEKEFTEMVLKHYANLHKKQIDPNKAALLTKAYSQSKLISSWFRDGLIEETKKIGGINENLKRELPLTTREIAGELVALIDKKEWKKAVHLVESLEQADGAKEFLFAYLYLEEGRAGFNLNGLEQAETYARISTDKNFPIAPYLLIWSLYLQNKDKAQVYKLVNERSLIVLGADGDACLPVIKVWAGDFKAIKEDLLNLIRKENAYLKRIFIGLLIHHQSPLVLDLFESPDVGPGLKEKFLPVYYATQLLTLDAQPISIKIPPEIREVINDLLIAVYKGRDFYYNTNEEQNYRMRQAPGA
ncbi:MAG: AAA family ATPase [Bacteroidetes bacterium]|nr:AAA family ATPase [Bacteroidota bacterium]